MLDSFYLDACSTTPLYEDVVDKINYINSNIYGNPSSLHSIGQKSAFILEKSRSEIADKFATNFEDIIFTSGATESINLAIKGIGSNIKPGRIIISDVEHSAVNLTANQLLSKGWVIDKWPVDNFGRLRLDEMDRILARPTKFVSLIWAQSEVGTVQPIELIASECRKRGIYFHTDATQLIPHSLVKFGNSSIDLLSASAHKFRGPKGIGLLLANSRTRKFLRPIITGGPQEFGFRSGTEPIALIAGMNSALKYINHQMDIINDKTIFRPTEVSELTNKLLLEITKIKGVKIVGNHNFINRIPNHISLLIEDRYGKPISSRKLVKDLSNKGILVSSGSACNSGITERNETLEAMGYENKWLRSLLRISTGSWICTKDIGRITQIFHEVLTSQ